MSDPFNEPTQSAAKPDELQFDHAEMDGADESAGLNCHQCNQPLVATYYQVNQEVVCPNCTQSIGAMIEGGSRTGRIFKALLFGTIAAAVGSVIWYAIGALTGYEIGLIAIVIGVMVGGAVRAGSGGRGGWVYQLLAVGLTYLSIVTSYIPQIYQAFDENSQQEVSQFDGMQFEKVAFLSDDSVEVNDQAAELQDAMHAVDRAVQNGGAVLVFQDDPEAETAAFLAWSSYAGGTLVDVYSIDDRTATRPQGSRVDEIKKHAWGPAFLFVVVFALSLAAPFLSGLQNLIGLLIIAFALYQAWKMNKKLQLEIAGPFHIGGTSPVPMAVSAPPVSSDDDIVPRAS